VPGGQQVPAGLRHPAGGLGELPPLAGQVNLTVPLTTLLGTAGSPGEVPGYGPVDAATARALACALAGHRATRWHITVTGPDGTALATGTHHGQPGAGNAAADRGKPDTPGRPGAPPGQAGGSGWTVQVTAEPIAGISCDHRTAEPGYRPSPSLQRLIRARTVTCTGPGCRRPAARCDLDHTRPHDDGGITCECNLAPLCRFCHRLKHSQHWQLLQPAPGVMIWITPAGRRYVTLPSQHPT
jgi:hypothetical protein